VRNRCYPLLATTWTIIALVKFHHVEQFQPLVIFRHHHRNSPACFVAQCDLTLTKSARPRGYQPGKLDTLQAFVWCSFWLAIKMLDQFVWPKPSAVERLNDAVEYA
jgi:hypothetical protein